MKLNFSLSAVYIEILEIFAFMKPGIITVRDHTNFWGELQADLLIGSLQLNRLY